MEIVAAIIGGSFGAAIVSGAVSLITWRLNRNAKKEDTAQENKLANCAARAEQIAELKTMVQVLFLADRTILYDRIKHLGKIYITRGWITVEELEDLSLMHSVYHDKDKLNGNGFLDDLMKNVRKLPLRSNKKEEAL